MNRTLSFILIFSLFSTLGVAQTSLYGKITDSESNIIGANIVLKQNGIYKAEVSTGFDGNYSLQLKPGTYDVEVSYIGFPPNLVTGVVVLAEFANLLDVQLDGSGIISLDEVVVLEYKVPLISIDVCGAGSLITADQIRNLPTKNIQELAIKTARLSSVDQDDSINIRTYGVDYYIDGKLVSISKRRFRIRNLFKKHKVERRSSN